MKEQELTDFEKRCKADQQKYMEEMEFDLHSIKIVYKTSTIYITFEIYGIRFNDVMVTCEENTYKFEFPYGIHSTLSSFPVVTFQRYDLWVALKKTIESYLDNCPIVKAHLQQCPDQSNDPENTL